MLNRFAAILSVLLFLPGIAGKSADSFSSPWETEKEKRSRWWSFQPLLQTGPPEVSSGAWAEHPIDRFLFSKIQAKGLAPSPEADRRTMIRRLSFALTGLPPKPEDVRAFLEDAAPDAYARVVDRLLNSPRFGEHWARHWMDWVRYAETHGSEGDPEIPNAWRYRDYLIRALNADVPWDRMIREHIAGDLLPDPRWNTAEGINESMLGTAQLRFVEHGFNPVDTLDEQVKTVDNQIDVISKAFQGLTVSCARCHDHKFDPISQREYYAMYGVFASVRPSQVTIDTPDRLRVNRAELQKLKEEIKSQIANAWEKRAREIMEGSEPEAIAGDALQTRIDELAAEIQRIDLTAKQAFLRGRGITNAPNDYAFPIAAWTFEKDARDSIGELHGELRDGALVRHGRLVLEKFGPFVQTKPLHREIREKTLEAWVVMTDLEQQGGGVLTLETSNGRVFDSIVFAEKARGRWMAGSDFYVRGNPESGPREKSVNEAVHLAIVYAADHGITMYRNGEVYLPRFQPVGQAAALQAFPAGGARLLIGKRHTGGGQASFKGEIEEARLYDRALTGEQVRASFLVGPGAAEPLMASLAHTEDQQNTRTRLLVGKERLEKELKELNPNYAAQREARVARKAAAEKLRAILAGQNKTNQAPPSAKWDVAGEDAGSWFSYGINPPERVRAPGEFSLLFGGPRLLDAILPAGVYSHLLSQKHNGVFASRRFRVESDYISVLAMGGKGARVRLVPDHYPIGSGNIYPQARLNSDRPSWVRLDVSYRKGSIAYLEFATADEVTARDRSPSGPDGRSFFGVQKVVFHDSKEAPAEEPLRATNVLAAIRAWKENTLSSGQSALLNKLLEAELLPVQIDSVPGVAILIANYRALEDEIPVARRAPGVLEGDSFDAPLLFRGEHLKPREPVPRGYLEVAGSSAPFASVHSGRLELAHQITDPRNPLTARVLVNRVWHYLFGRGLVPTVDNFGLLGEKPSHPALLDYLANRFIEQGWSAKDLIRFLVISRAYRGSSEASTELTRVDPENELLARMPLRRLNAEEIRDSLLAVSGRLEEAMFGPADDALAAADKQRRRSVYLTVRRNFLSPFLETFDAPRPFSTLGRRDNTNVPAQSLALLNDPFVLEQASAWSEAGATDEERINRMFEQAFARPPSSEELLASTDYLKHATWGDLALSFFNLKEFIYVR